MKDYIARHYPPPDYAILKVIPSNLLPDIEEESLVFLESKRDYTLANDFVGSLQYAIRCQEMPILGNDMNLDVVVKEVNGSWAQALANRGEIVVAAWYNPVGTHGHVAIVMPNFQPFDNKRGAYLLNAGLDTGFMYASKAFGDRSVSYFHIRNK